MLLSAAEHEVGPRNGHLILRTFREGMAAVVGHDLVIEATRWQGTITIPGAPDSQPRLAVEVDLRALEVREGHGGQAAHRQRPSRGREGHRQAPEDRRLPAGVPCVHHGWGRRDQATVDGELTLLGLTRPLRLTAQVTDDRAVIGSASVQQSRWGIRPYRGFMGALRVRDAVEVQATVTLA